MSRTFTSFLALKNLLGFFLFITTIALQAQIVTNPITGTNPNTSNPYTIGQTTDPNVTSTGIGRGAGISGAAANDRYNAQGFSLGAIDLTDYFEINITPNAGFKISYSTIDFTLQRSPTGPTSAQLRTSFDGFASPVGTVTTGPSPGVANSVDISALVNQTATVTIRIYGYGAGAAAGTLSVNDFTVNGMTMPVAAMPIDLIAFEVANKSKTNTIKWSTASEVNNSHFELHHSTDGIVYNTISKVKGNGNSSRNIDYSFVHKVTQNGNHYYRLRQVDFDGQSELFDAKMVAIEGGKTIRIYPTLATDYLNVEHQDASPYAILDYNGKIISEGLLNGKIDVSQLAKGSYIFKAQNETMKFIKQ